MSKTYRIYKEVDLTKAEFVQALRDRVKTKFAVGDIVEMEIERLSSGYGEKSKRTKETRLGIVVASNPMNTSAQVAHNHVKVGSFGITDGWYETWLSDDQLTLIK